MQCPHCSVALPSDARFCSGCGQPVSGARGPVPVRSNTWLIVLVVCVVGLGMVMMVGIIAAIAIPNFLNAVDRGKQKRTMADMRTISRALESYAVDHQNKYPVAADLQSLRSELVPEYAATLPLLDGWRKTIQLTSEATTYELVSFGKGGVPGPCDAGATSQFQDDICFRDGQFTQWPEGVQR